MAVPRDLVGGGVGALFQDGRSSAAGACGTAAAPGGKRGQSQWTVVAMQDWSMWANWSAGTGRLKK